MKLIFTLAWRNIWRNKKRTLITVASILFAVLFALFGASVNKGTHEQMIGTMSEFHTGYLRMQDTLYQDEPSLDNAMYVDEDFIEEVLAANDAIDFVVPRIETFMLATGDVQSRAIMLLGVDFDLEDQMNGLKSRLAEGQFPDAESAVVLGSRLANRMDVAVGDSLVLLGQGRFGTTAAGIYPISGIIQHPLPNFDNQVVYMRLNDARDLLMAEDHLTALLISPRTIRSVDNISRDLNQQYEQHGLVVLNWGRLMPDLKQAIDFDISSQYIFSGILYIVIGFGLFGTMLMMTLERQRELGVLMSVGMHRKLLAQVMFLETIMISVLGILSGILLGFLSLLYFYHNPIPLSGSFEMMIDDLGYEPYISFSIDPALFYMQALIISIISVFVGLYPVRNVMKLNILDAARGN